MVKKISKINLNNNTELLYLNYLNILQKDINEELFNIIILNVKSDVIKISSKVFDSIKKIKKDLYLKEDFKVYLIDDENKLNTILKIINSEYNSKNISIIYINDNDLNEYNKDDMFISLCKIKSSNNLLNFQSIVLNSDVDIDYLNNLSKYSKFGGTSIINDINDIKTIIIDNYNSIKEYRENSYLNIEFDGKLKVDILQIYNSKCKLYTDITNNPTNINIINGDNKFYMIIKNNDNIEYNININMNSKNFNTVCNLSSNNINKLSLNQISKPIYGFAKEYYKLNMNYEAIDTLNFLRDKINIDKIFNSHTLEEKFLTLIDLEMAYKNTKYRYIDTAPENYIKSFNEYCVLDILSELSKVGAKFIPIEECEYNDIRIGNKRKDLLKGTFNRDYSLPLEPNMKNLIFNESRLNISINYSIPGYIKINQEDIDRYGLPEKINTVKYRNQTIIKDGKLNMNSIKINIDINQINKLSKSFKEYLDRYCNYNPSLNIYTIMINKLPITNRKYTENITEDYLLKLVEDITIRKAKQRIYNNKIKEDNNETDMLFMDTNGNFNKYSFNEEQLNVLKEKYGLNSNLQYVGKYDNSYEEIINKEEKINTFSFGIKGSISIPTIKKVEEKIENNKKLNFLEGIMKETLEEIDRYKNINETLINIKKNNKNILNTKLRELFIYKFSKIYTGGWWKFETNEKGEEYYSNPAISNNTLVVKVKEEII